MMTSAGLERWVRGKGTCHKSCQLEFRFRKPTWWEERTDSHELFLDLHTHQDEHPTSKHPDQTS